MAKISNTTSYPQVVPSLDDYVIGTHIAGTPTNQTTNFKISDIKTAIGADNLQEVLDEGNSATQNILLTGDITLVDSSSDLKMNGGNIDVQTNNLSILAPSPGQELLFNISDRIRGLSQVVTFSASDSATVSATNILSLYGDAGVVISTNNAAALGNDLYLQTNQNLVAEGNQLGLSGVASITLETTASPTSLELSGGKITAQSVLDLTANNGLTLAGVSGSAGEVVTSQGPGLPLTWTTPTNLPSLASTNIWVGDSLNVATPTSLVSVNITTSDIEIGSPTSKTTLKGTLAAGVTYPIGTNNVALGLNSLNINNTTGSRNSALGVDSGKDVTTGSDNTLIGNGSGVGLVATSGNTLIGASSIIKDPLLTANATAVGFESECDDSGVALGYKSSALSGGVSLGAEATSESECIAIGYSSTANVHPTTNNPLINFRGNLINDLVAQNTIYADNTAAIADGLKAGDVYLLDNTTIGIAAVGATAGPAIMCVAYTP